MAPTASFAKTSTQVMYRLYNKYSGEHLYTADASEKTTLVKIGWNDEGVGWIAPTKSKTPVYRLYNKYSGDHHYTTSKGEYDACVRQGWNGEGVGFYSDDAKGVTVYRLYNKYLIAGTHHYTTSKNEYDYLGKIGWSQENIGWYGVDNQGDTKEITYDDEVIVVKGFTQNGNKYTFTSSQNTSGRDPKVGDKIVLEFDDGNVKGTFGTVKTVSKSGDKTTVTITEGKSLDLVFDEFDISGDDLKLVKNKIILADGVEFDTATDSQSLALGSDGASEALGTKAELGDLKFTLKETEFVEGVKGSFSVTWSPTIDADCKWTSAKGLEYAYLNVDGETKINAKIEAEAKDKHKLFSLPVAKIPYTLYGIFTLWVDVNLEGSVGGGVTLTYELSNTFTAKYDGKKVTFDDKAKDFDSNVKADAKIKTGIGPDFKFDVLCLTVIDFECSVGAEMGFETTLRSTGLVCTDAGGWVYAEMAACNNSPGFQLLGISWSKDLWDKDNSPISFVDHYENDKKVKKCTYKDDGGKDPDPSPDPDPAEFEDDGMTYPEPETTDADSEVQFALHKSSGFTYLGGYYQSNNVTLSAGHSMTVLSTTDRLDAMIGSPDARGATYRITYTDWPSGEKRTIITTNCVSDGSCISEVGTEVRIDVLCGQVDINIDTPGMSYLSEIPKISHSTCETIPWPIRLSKLDLTMSVGDTYTMHAVDDLPDLLTEEEELEKMHGLKFYSEDSSIVSINPTTGEMTAKSKGTTRIYALDWMTDRYCTVTVE